MKITAIVAAALIAATPLAASAQSVGEGYDMLSTSLMNQFEVIGVEMSSIEGLTLAQLAQIRAVLEDDDQSTAQKRNRIETIIEQ